MVTNKQLTDILNRDGIHLTEVEIDSIRVLMVELARIEYTIFKAMKNDAVEMKVFNNLSSNLNNAA